MKKFAKIINVLICGVLVFGMFKISELQNQIDNLRNEINNTHGYFENKINLIYNNVSSMLEEENNQLTINEWEYVNVDVKNRKAKILCTVIPKEFNPNITKTKIMNDNQEYLLDYVDGKYVAEIEVPLFETTDFNQVQLNDNGAIRTQKLNWEIMPMYEALIQTFVHYDGSTGGTYGENAYVWKPNITVEFNIEKMGTFEIKSIELAASIDGNEINRSQVDITSSGQKKYVEEITKKGGNVFEDLGMGDGYANFIYPYKNEMNIPNGSELLLYVDVIDENNLTHRTFLECIPINKDGKIDEDKKFEFLMNHFSETNMILDENGKILYELVVE